MQLVVESKDAKKRNRDLTQDSKNIFIFFSLIVFLCGSLSSLLSSSCWDYCLLLQICSLSRFRSLSRKNLNKAIPQDLCMNSREDPLPYLVDMPFTGLLITTRAVGRGPMIAQAYPWSFQLYYLCHNCSTLLM